MSRTAEFKKYNGTPLPAGIRVFGPGATPAQDFEPEYIAVSADSATAYVTLQENNAIAVLDIKAGEFTRLMPLGFKDHSATGNGLDVSDRDDKIDIRNWPVLGLYMPDAIASFQSNGRSYLITANEGDTREYTAFGEERRVSAVRLDPGQFPNAADLQKPEQLGRLTVSAVNADLRRRWRFRQAIPAWRAVLHQSGLRKATWYSTAAISWSKSPRRPSRKSSIRTLAVASTRGATTRDLNPRL